jgi:hypothetical protein
MSINNAVRKPKPLPRDPKPLEPIKRPMPTRRPAPVKPRKVEINRYYRTEWEY